MEIRKHLKNILLIYPKTPENSYWSYSHCLGMIGKKAGTPPLGLLTVASMLPENEFALRLIDMNVTDLRDEDIEWADTIFVSAMIAQRASMEQVLRRMRPFGKPVVAGGPYSSSAYAELENIDVFVIGEAEGTRDRFLADLRADALKPVYASPVRQREMDELQAFFGKSGSIEQSASYPDVNLAPLPRFDLLDLDQYAVMPVQASRGCPVGCAFCDIWRRYGRKTRIKASERILAEMDELYRLGWRDSVFLVDDNFIGNRSRAKEVLTELAKWQKAHSYPFTFLTEATLSLADDPEMLDLMAEVGFASVFVGIETPSEASLRETGKQINLTGSMAEKVAKIQAKGIQLMSGFIIGFDADPDDISELMTKCIQELGIPQAMIGLLNALPDTDLYDRLDGEKRIRSATTGNNTHAFSMNFKPARPEADVLRDYKEVLERAYPADMKSYFERCSVLRDHWPVKSGHGSPLPLAWKLKVAGKYLWTIVKMPYRFTALRFFAASIWKKPSFLEQAMELGIKGHHHWVITRQAFEVEAMRTRLSAHWHTFTSQVESSLAALGSAFGSAPQPLNPAETTLDGVVAFLRSAMEMDIVTAETAALREKITDVIAEIDQYGKHVQQQAEKEYLRLSNTARTLLVDDMERFLQEVNTWCASVSSAR